MKQLTILIITIVLCVTVYSVHAQDQYLRAENAASSAKHSSRVPVIGILTQPKSTLNARTFTNDQYVLEVNRNFIEVGGSIAVPIQYDINDEDLYSLLDQINGVHFTGGGLVLINSTTGQQHQYYQTAKKIFEYAKIQKDTFNQSFVLTGFCQGFELLNLLASGDVKDLLKDIVYDNVERRAIWETNVNQIKTESKMFSGFTNELLTSMADNEITFHFHDYGVTVEDYNNTSIKDFFKIISIDYYKNISYLTGLEAYNYPIYTLMYHPEYQMMDFLSEETFNQVQNNDTMQIIENISTFIKEQALGNDHQFTDIDQLSQLEFDNFDEEAYKLTSKYVVVAYSIPSQYNTQTTSY